ncbi:MAG: hypothetical protein PHV82_07875, partial [Victivallaceae bacterium]|nr:hypothetical protein [Victivallaceae bacterium]
MIEEPVSGDLKFLHEFIESTIKELLDVPQYNLPKPWMKTAIGGSYKSACFLWDNFHMCIRLAQAGHPEHFKYLAENFIAFGDRDSGFVPAVIFPAANRAPSAPDVMPFLAQA